MFGTAGRGLGIAKHPLWNLPVVFFFEAFPWIAGLEMQTATTLCHTARGLKAYCSLAKGFAVTPKWGLAVTAELDTGRRLLS